MILSQEEYDIISQIVMSLRTNEYTAMYFQQSSNTEIQYQVDIYFDYEGVECKALLDMVIINHQDNTIQPIDIKTMGEDTLNFASSLRKRRYDIQAAFYTEALKSVYPGYTILPFKFIVESTTNIGNPIVYTLDESLLEIGKFGRPQIYLSGEVSENGSVKRYGRLDEIKGFHQLIELYKYYTDNGFEIDQIVKERQAELSLDWSGIIV